MRLRKGSCKARRGNKLVSYELNSDWVGVFDRRQLSCSMDDVPGRLMSFLRCGSGMRLVHVCVFSGRAGVVFWCVRIGLTLVYSHRAWGAKGSCVRLVVCILSTCLGVRWGVSIFLLYMSV